MTLHELLDSANPVGLKSTRNDMTETAQRRGWWAWVVSRGHRIIERCTRTEAKSCFALRVPSWFIRSCRMGPGELSDSCPGNMQSTNREHGTPSTPKMRRLCWLLHLV
jgi:hypothetical protein